MIIIPMIPRHSFDICQIKRNRASGIISMVDKVMNKTSTIVLKKFLVFVQRPLKKFPNLPILIDGYYLIIIYHSNSLYILCFNACVLIISNSLDFFMNRNSFLLR